MDPPIPLGLTAFRRALLPMTAAVLRSAGQVLCRVLFFSGLHRAVGFLVVGPRGTAPLSSHHIKDACCHHHFITRPPHCQPSTLSSSRGHHFEAPICREGSHAPPLRGHAVRPMSVERCTAALSPPPIYLFNHLSVSYGPMVIYTAHRAAIQRHCILLLKWFQLRPLGTLSVGSWFL